jgi:hypothetical protein
MRERGSQCVPAGQQLPSGRRRDVSEQTLGGASHVRSIEFQRFPGGQPHHPLEGMTRPSGQRGGGATQAERSQLHTVP